MRIRVVAFARLREIVNAAETELEVRAGARAGDAFTALAEAYPTLEDHRLSTRIACNGRLVAPDYALHDGDEIALLPPVGGG